MSFVIWRQFSTNNDTTFTCRQFKEFVSSWSVHLRFRCAYVPSGNGIVERNHRSVKTIATRKNCSVLEAVYWYNVTPKDNLSPSTAPADVLHTYHIRVRGIDATPPPESQITEGEYKGTLSGSRLRGKCITKFGTGHVTEVVSQQSVRVNGTPRHVRDLRPFLGSNPTTDEDTEDSEQPIYVELGSTTDHSDCQ